MRASMPIEEQITFALKQAEQGTPVSEVIRKMGITEQTYYRRILTSDDLHTVS
jgi:putative transposase